jgi:hypothetical protein
LLGAAVHVGVLTNSTVQGADAAPAAAGLGERFELVIGSDEVQKFKPHPRVYEHGGAAKGRPGRDRPHCGSRLGCDVRDAGEDTARRKLAFRPGFFG